MQLSNTSNTHKFLSWWKFKPTAWVRVSFLTTMGKVWKRLSLCPPTLQASYFLSWILSDPQWNQTLSDSDQQQKRDSAFLRCGGNQPHPAGHADYHPACSKVGEYSSQILSASLWRSRNPHCNLSTGRPAGSCPLPAVSRRLSWELDCWRHLKMSCPWQEICTESRKCTQTCI